MNEPPSLFPIDITKIKSIKNAVQGLKYKYNYSEYYKKMQIYFITIQHKLLPNRDGVSFPVKSWDRGGWCNYVLNKLVKLLPFSQFAAQ